MHDCVPPIGLLTSTTLTRRPILVQAVSTGVIDPGLQPVFLLN